MPAEDTFEEIVQITRSPSTLDLVLGSRAPNGDLALHRVNLEEEVTEQLKTVPTRLSRQLKNAELLDYQPGFRPDSHQVAYLETADQDAMSAVMESLANPGDLPLFAGTDEFVEYLGFYVFSVNDDGRNCLLFRATGPRLELTRRRPFSFIFSNGQYNKLDGRVFSLDRDVDCVYRDEYIFIRNVPAFESIFDFFAELVQRARETIDTVTTALPIANVDLFRDTCLSDPRMLRKLATVSRQTYLATLTMRQIRRFITNSGLDIPVERGEDGVYRLVFDAHPRRRWKLLNLLDDAYLTSRLTDVRYQVNSKRRIPPT